VEEGPETLIGAHPSTSVHQSLTIHDEGSELGLLEVLDEHPVGVLHGCMNLERFRILILMVVRGKRVLSRIMTACNNFAATHERPNTIMPKLGVLFMRRIHEPKKD
jgi:hypothetical protein